MRVFIGGIMQGSELGRGVYDQSYRQAISRTIRAQHPDAEIIDPVALFPDSVGYDDDRARRALFDMSEEAARAEVVIAYLPRASMGTALEVVRAYDAGTPVVSISSMAHNWFVRFLSRHIFPSLEAFDDWVVAGGLAALTDSRAGRKETQ